MTYDLSGARERADAGYEARCHLDLTSRGEPRLMGQSRISPDSAAAITRLSQAALIGRVVLFVKTGRAALQSLWSNVAGHGALYRRESHYMRGPGPKWRERHARRTHV